MRLLSLLEKVEPADVDSLDLFDPRFLDVFRPFVRHGLRRWFRTDIEGMERIPAGPAMLVSNHNAGITFLEPMVFADEFYRTRGTGERLYVLTHDAIMRMPAVGHVVRHIGMIRATRENGRRVLDAGQKLMVFPGGNHEAFRTWHNRYRIDFGGHRGYAALALAASVPIVPIVYVGGHETFVVLTRGERLARLLRTEKLLHSKAFPIFLALPWGIAVGPVFHLPLPARCSVRVGEPIQPMQAVGRLDPSSRVGALDALVRERLQAMMDEAAARRRLPVLG